MSPRVPGTLLLCVLLSSFTGAARGCPAPGTNGTLPDAAIRLEYAGARLRLEDMRSVLVDTGTVMVPPGEHRLTLYLPSREGLWRPPLIGRTISVAAGDTLVIDPTAVLTIHVSTRPDGAVIRIAGAAAGTTPCLVSFLRWEDRDMVVTKAGYRTAAVSPGAAGDGPIRIRLEPAGDARPAVAGGRPRAEWLPWATFSAFAASTAAGFYSRRRADDLYDQYLHTASADRRDDLFDRAAAWDGRARVLWIGGQVALGASVWLLLRHIRRGEADGGRGLDLSIDPTGPVGPTVRVAWAWGGASR